MGKRMCKALETTPSRDLLSLLPPSATLSPKHRPQGGQDTWRGTRRGAAQPQALAVPNVPAE